MKTKLRMRLVSLCGLWAAIAFTQNLRGADEPSPSSSAEKSSSAPALSPALTRSEAPKLIAASRKYVAHPGPKSPNGTRPEPEVITPGFEMADPPPAPRTETKPAAPEPGYVWVAGHYMPVKKEWRWVRGEWAVPALPISVWMESHYDAKAKKWSPGYWQPDAPATPPAEPPPKTSTPPAAPPGY